MTVIYCFVFWDTIFYTLLHAKYNNINIYYGRQPYDPAAQDRSPTEAKQGWVWSVPGWETSWEN